jgi:hypothetical protein
MSAFDVTTVLEALRTQPVDRNGMLLQYEVPQPVYKTTGGRTFRDPKANDVTEENIIGYSVYMGRNAHGDYERVVAHKGQSHVMHDIAVKTSVQMNDTIAALISKNFTTTEVLDAGSTEGLVGRLLMDYLGKPVLGPKSEAFERFFDGHHSKLESWVPLLTITPYLSKFNVHDMLWLGKHDTIEAAINACSKLRGTHLF